MRTKPPCKQPDGSDCPRRHVGCQSECEEYTKWQAIHQQERAAQWLYLCGHQRRGSALEGHKGEDRQEIPKQKEGWSTVNRTEELRNQLVGAYNAAIRDFEDGGNPELDGDYVTIDIITAKRTVELLKKVEATVEAKWYGYTNEEGKARWKCTNCGKLVRRRPSDKKRCSWCGAYMSEEA